MRQQRLMPPPEAKRRVGLDKPCAICGRAIHHTYKGPVEGLCGKCADRATRRAGSRQRPGAGRCTIVRRPGLRGRTAALLVLMAFLAGAAAMYYGRGLLPF